MASSLTAGEIIDRLGLIPHPIEGGFFAETYRSSQTCAPGAPYDGERPAGTAIYYFLTPDTYSALHRLPGDEIFHFYLGDPVEMLELHPDGRSSITTLGHELDGMTLQHVVSGGHWQGSRLVDGGAWALLGTTMAPGFSYDDYERGTADLADEYPAMASAIIELLPDRAAE